MTLGHAPGKPDDKTQLVLKIEFPGGIDQPRIRPPVLHRHPRQSLRHTAIRSNELGKLEEMLEESRLAKEGFFYRPPMTESEREWLSKNRTADAAHWNILADMRLEQLSYAR
jgi:hypothetical protein